MASQLATVADAIVTELTDLQAGAWGHATFTVERAWLHEFDHKAAPSFQCKVAALTLAIEDIARGYDQRDVEVICTFHKRLTALTNAALDPLSEAVEAVLENYLDAHALTDAFDWRVESAELGGGINEVIDEATLITENVFWSQLKILIRRQQETGGSGISLESSGALLLEA